MGDEPDGIGNSVIPAMKFSAGFSWWVASASQQMTKATRGWPESTGGEMTEKWLAREMMKTWTKVVPRRNGKGWTEKDITKDKTLLA